MKKIILLLLLFTLAISSNAQTKSISGIVKDATGETIIGATIVEAGTSNGVITDLDGNFSLNVSSGSKITISFIGYETQTIPVGNQSSFIVVLKENMAMLDEVVVTGYGGTQKRAALTTAISKLDNAALENAAYSNAGQSLQGSVTGLRVTFMSGQPGSEPDIQLRGGATITGENSKALIIVDGIVRDNLGDINPSDIESIQVLKDAASTAIYGARANGGVILVETKSAKEGKSSLNYKFKIGVNMARKGYEYLNAQDYIYYNRLGAANAGLAPEQIEKSDGYGLNNSKGIFDIFLLDNNNAHLKNEGYLSMTDPLDASRTILFKDYSGILDDALFDNSAMTQDHYLSFNGGNDKATYSSSLGYYSEEGQVKKTTYERFTGSLNGSYKLFPFLTVKAGMTYSWSVRPELYIGTYEMFYRVRCIRPTWNPWLEDGSPAAGVGPGDGNPDYYRERLTNKNSTIKSTYNTGFALSILPKKLILNANAYLYNYNYQKETFDKAYQSQTGSATNTRQAYAAINKFNQIQLNATLNYTDTFAEKHNLDVMLGGEYFAYNQFNFSATTQNSPTDDIPTLNVGATRSATSSTKTGYRILSAFGRVNYNYQMKYLFSFVARYDGISKLKDNRWGFFPGVSIGWNIMEEDFWKNSNISATISNLKPRLSYGVNGNVNGVGNFEVYGEYGKIGTTYDGATGFYNSGLINTNLRWEQSQTLEAGLDISFLNNRLNFIFDYYNRTTQDLLTKQALPGYTGFESITTNMGSLRNYGFEAELKASIFNAPDGFSWDISGNISSVANKIVKLPYNGVDKNRVGGYEVGTGRRNPDGTAETVWIAGRQEGGVLGELVAYKQKSIFKNWDEIREKANNRLDEVANLYGPGKAAEYANKPGWKPIEPGDVNWEDFNGDEIINGYDRTVVGNVFPNITGGFSTTLGYKGVSLYARFDYALGHTLYNDVEARTLGQFQGTLNNVVTIKNMWSETNIDSDLPAFSYADQLNKKNIARGNNGLTAIDNNSSRFYEKGDYLALRELTLSYKLPKQWISYAKLTETSIYVTAQNLAYFTKYSGNSPEPVVSTVYGRGIDNGRYLIPRSVLFGLSLTF